RLLSPTQFGDAAASGGGNGDVRAVNRENSTSKCHTDRSSAPSLNLATNPTLGRMPPRWWRDTTNREHQFFSIFLADFRVLLFESIPPLPNL
ncbi:hypothetical protein HAX54_045799, partial [Datura stramonium]|nr:hypothetical protein [Datura stramonium]